MILIHHDDLDGRCAAAVVLRAYPRAEPIEMNYEQPIPWDRLEGQDVWIVDFCLQPFAKMERLQKLAKSITWIDHHKSAIDAAQLVDFLCNGVQEEGRAGCELAWSFCFPRLTMPRAVTLLGRFDVWDHADPEVVPFQFGMLAARNDPSSSLWTILLNDEGFAVAKIVANGRVVRAYQESVDKETAKSHAFGVDFEGLRALAMNVAGRGALIFESIFDPDHHDIMIRFAWFNGSWTVSLYSYDGGVDVGDLCKKHGGGGHPGAGGFQCKKLPFKLPARDRAADDTGEQ